MATELSKFSTKELHEELAKREGVREIVIDPEDTIFLTTFNAGVVLDDCGPARILVNID